MNTSEEKLIAAGWIKATRSKYDTEDQWADPAKPTRKRSTSGALEIQTERERWQAGKSVYQATRCGHGYGYVIYEYPAPNLPGELIFRHEDKEITKDALLALNKNPKAELLLEGKLQSIKGFVTSKNFKAIIVCEEKHSTRYFDASTIEQFAKSCLQILKERAEWILKSPCWDTEVQIPELGKETIAGMKDGALKRAAEEQWTAFEHATQSKKEEQEHFEDIRRALSENNGLLAAGVLEDRNDNEYERFKVESLIVP